MKSKKWLVLASLVMMSALSVMGQIQSGYVRTAGRPDNKEGKRIPGVEIRFRGKHNAVVCNKKGDFNVNLGGGETSYVINSVSREGYELQESELLGRREPVSESIPKEIVMVSLKEKKQIEDKVRRQVENKYQQKLAVLQRELKEKSISEEKYKSEMQRLNDEYDLRDRLVHDMVERYANSDYAKMSSKEVEINTYIENGELEKADSVINSLNISKLEQDRVTLLQDIGIKERQIAAEKSSVRSIDSTLWMAYRAKADIAFANFQNDSAVYYLEKLLMLDSTNVSLMIMLGNICDVYLADGKKALAYFNKARRLLDEEPTSVQMVICLNDIGACYKSLGNLDSARIMLEEAIRIAHQENYLHNIALALNNLSGVYGDVADRENQKKCLDEALSIYKSLYGEKNQHIIVAYNNFCSFYVSIGEYRKAVDYGHKALKVMPIRKDIYKNIAPSYGNLGNAYHSLGMLDSAEYYYNKAAEMFVTVYGENHPNVAIILGNLSSVYEDMGNMDKSMEQLRRALAINRSFYVDYHRSIAENLSNLSVLYATMGNIDSAMYYAMEAERVCIALDSVSPLLLYVYTTLGSIHAKKGVLQTALSYFIKADKIAHLYPGENMNGVASLYGQMGFLFSSVGMNEKAMEYFDESLELLDKLYDHDNYHYLILLNNMGVTHSHMKNREKTFECFDRIEKILETTKLQETQAAADVYRNISISYYDFESYDTALAYLHRAHRIFGKYVSYTSNEYIPMLINFMKTYEKTKQYDSAMVYAQKQLEIYKRESTDTLRENWYIHGSIDLYLHRLGRIDEATEYMADKTMAFDVMPDGKLSSLGYSGTYYVMEMGEWNAYDSTYLGDAFKKMQGSGTVLIYQNGTFVNVSLSDMGIDGVYIKVIGRERKNELLKEYDNRK